MKSPGATLLREGKPSWRFEFDSDFNELIHRTKKGNVYAILFAWETTKKPFWIGRYIPHAGWVTMESEIRAKCISFDDAGVYWFSNIMRDE